MYPLIHSYGFRMDTANIQQIPILTKSFWRKMQNSQLFTVYGLQLIVVLSFLGSKLFELRKCNQTIVGVHPNK